MIEVVSPGPLCTVQDGGRAGWAHLGIGRSGAVDRPAFELGNRLVGNPPGAAALEATFGGLVLTMRSAGLLAVTGAPCATAITRAGMRTGIDLGDQQPVAVAAGSTITFSTPRSGVRTYVSIRGGVVAPMVLGSCSTDLLSGLGPPPLRAGDLLSIGPDQDTPVPSEAAPRRPPSSEPVTIWPGPRTAWFTRSAIDRLESDDYTVQSTSNRIGVRLAGAALARAGSAELPSEGVIEGAVQVPTDGQPLIFLADHPTTGGYPVIAVVDRADIARVAQARPGDRLSFRWAVPR